MSKQQLVDSCGKNQWNKIGKTWTEIVKTDIRLLNLIKERIKECNRVNRCCVEKDTSKLVQVGGKTNIKMITYGS